MANVTGQRQSPIDIVTKQAQVVHKLTTRSIADTNNNQGGECPPAGEKRGLHIDYSPIASSSSQLSLENTGHGWRLNVPDSLAKACPISGGPLGLSEYRLAQVHAHWGKNSTSGSEHTIDGKSYACEVHLVHWNATKYGEQAEALQAPDGLAVVGVFIDVCSGQPNKVFDQIGAVLGNILARGSVENKVAECLDLHQLLPAEHEYFSYLGSLTTPPYSESVIWIVMKTPVAATEEQIAKFRQLYEGEADSHRVEENWRQVQPLCDRDVLLFA